MKKTILAAMLGAGILMGCSQVEPEPQVQAQPEAQHAESSSPAAIRPDVLAKIDVKYGKTPKRSYILMVAADLQGMYAVDFNDPIATDKAASEYVDRTSCLLDGLAEGDKPMAPGFVSQFLLDATFNTAEGKAVRDNLTKAANLHMYDHDTSQCEAKIAAMSA